MTIQQYIYMGAVVLAFLSSLTSFGSGFSFSMKLFSILLGLTLGVEIGALLLERANRNNFWLYNAFAPLEFWVYGFFFLGLLKGKFRKRLLTIWVILAPLLWLLVYRLSAWNGYGMILGSFFTVVFVLLFYYELILGPDTRPLRVLPEFWIATGLLIFYLAALPFFGMLNYLVRHYLGVAKILAVVIMLLDALMYLLFSYAYLCKILTKKS